MGKDLKETPLTERETMEVVYDVMTRPEPAPKEQSAPRPVARQIQHIESKQTPRSVERDDYKPYKEFEREWKPYLDSLKIKPLEAAKHLLAVEHTLRFGSVDAKRQALTQIIKDYGLNAKELLTEEQRKPYVPPAVREQNDRLSKIEQDLKFRDDAEKKRVYQGVLSVVEKFKSEKGPDGNLLHPHVDKLEDDMAFLIQSRKAKSIAHAYQLALVMNEETRPLAMNNSARPPAQVQRVIPRGKSQIVRRVRPQSERETMETVWRRNHG